MRPHPAVKTGSGSREWEDPWLEETQWGPLPPVTSRAAKWQRQQQQFSFVLETAGHLLQTRLTVSLGLFHVEQAAGGFEGTGACRAPDEACGEG